MIEITASDIFWIGAMDKISFGLAFMGFVLVTKSVHLLSNERRVHMKSLKEKTPQCLARDPKFKVLGRTIRRVFSSHHGSKPWLGKISFSFIGTVLISWINARSFSFSSQKFPGTKKQSYFKKSQVLLLLIKREVTVP